MTTIGEVILNNKKLFEKALNFEYLVFGTFPQDLLDKNINISISQKKGGLILNINNGKLVIMINNFINNNKGGRKSKKYRKKIKSAKNKRKKRKTQKGGDWFLKLTGKILAVLLALLFGMRVLNPPDYRQLKNNPWQIDSTDIDVLFSKVTPVINLKNSGVSTRLLNDSLTRALTSNNTQQITNLPINMNLKPLSYAEFNISRFPAHTEMLNMFKNMSFSNRTYRNRGHRTVEYRIYGNWRLSTNGLVNIELTDPYLEKDINPYGPPEKGPVFHFPNRQDVEERILNFVTETIQIQKKIGMIRKKENEGHFRFILADFVPRKPHEETPLIHYDGMDTILERQKTYTRRNPRIGGIVSIIYPEATEISQPSITVDDDGNPIPDPRQNTIHGEELDRNIVKTKYIKGTPTTGQVQMHDQSQSVKHEAVGTKLTKRRILNLQILPINIEKVSKDPFVLQKRNMKKGKGGRKKRTRKRRK